jgi:hypothetical protein
MQLAAFQEGVSCTKYRAMDKVQEPSNFEGQAYLFITGARILVLKRAEYDEPEHLVRKLKFGDLCSHGVSMKSTIFYDVTS